MFVMFDSWQPKYDPKPWRHVTPAVPTLGAGATGEVTINVTYKESWNCFAFDSSFNFKPGVFPKGPGTLSGTAKGNVTVFCFGTMLRSEIAWQHFFTTVQRWTCNNSQQNDASVRIEEFIEVVAGAWLGLTLSTRRSRPSMGVFGDSEFQAS
ncbi:hypothetical protein [Nocardia nova]|uniref:hypothetical protein n=1 Tax=Nocardia nova TaxID=37330 RepID=UPI0015E3D0C3